MTNSIKAALISALVFPGAGHFFLKRHLSGTILTGTVLAALAVIVSRTIKTAQQIVASLELGDIPLDAAAITELLTQQPTGEPTNAINIASTVLLICWIYGIADSYLVGRAKDQETKEKR